MIRLQNKALELVLQREKDMAKKAKEEAQEAVVGVGQYYQPPNSMLGGMGGFPRQCPPPSFDEVAQMAKRSVLAIKNDPVLSQAPECVMDWVYQQLFQSQDIERRTAWEKTELDRRIKELAMPGEESNG
jgi:hypothetical protein